jgi:[ribosomal protein S5]-alanine N-acetyltransferase
MSPDVASITMAKIESDRLVLEPQVAAHAEAMFDVLRDPAIYQYENEPPSSVEWLRDRFTRLEARHSSSGQEHWLNWVIRLPAGELIGYVQATVYADGRAAIAYVLHSEYWGRGLASEAVRAMVGELKARYDVRRLSAVLKRDNRRSLSLLERLGFQRASAHLSATLEIEPDELLMIRD